MLKGKIYIVSVVVVVPDTRTRYERAKATQNVTPETCVAFAYTYTCIEKKDTYFM